MALVFTPVARSTKQFNFRMKPPSKKDELLSQRADGKQDLSHIDLLVAMLYVDKNSGSSLKGFLRNILFALSQKYTNEEVMEILSTGSEKYFKAENFMNTNEGGDEVSNYVDMIKSLSANGSVYSELVGDFGLFADKEEIDAVFYGPILEKIKNVNKVSLHAKPIAEQVDKRENKESSEPEEKKENDKKPSGKDGIEAKSDHFNDRMDKIRKQFDDIEASEVTKAFINSIIQMGEMEAIPKEEIGDYVATMLHGIGFIIPTIGAEEVEEMVAYLQNYMDQHTERILQQQIEHFER